MHIAYLVNQYPSISHTFIRREIRELERLGITVERYSIRDTREFVIDSADKQESERTTVLLRPMLCLWATLRLALMRPMRFSRAVCLDFALWRKGGGFVRHAAYLAEASFLATRLRSKVEHLHAHFGTNSASVALLCHSLGGPKFSFTVHGPTEFDRPESLSLMTKIAGAQFVVAISSFGKSQLSRWCHFSDWSKLHVVHCGLDDDFFALEPIPPIQSTTFVCVGRLTEQKGQVLLLEAAKQLVADGVEFRLILVGDGKLRAVLQSIIDSNGLANHVTITGWQTGDQVRQHILNARALVLPSFAEGLPVVIMESLAIARPVISTYVAGIPELVNSENGWLVPAGVVEELVVAMREALATPADQLYQMGLRGRERVMRLHHIDQSAKQLAALFAAEVGSESVF